MADQQNLNAPQENPGADAAANAPQPQQQDPMQQLLAIVKGLQDQVVDLQKDLKVHVV